MESGILGFGIHNLAQGIWNSAKIKARLHDRKNWNGSDKKTNGSDKI